MEQERARVEEAYSALLARYAPDATVRRLAWSGGATGVLELGHGPPLLYVHGGLAGAFECVPVLPSLARSHRVLAVDRPGHGLADPFDYRGVDLHDHARGFLRDILDALELPAVDVVANSLGGLFSVAFALAAPERVRCLALVGAPAGVTRDIPLPLRVLCLPVVGQRLGQRLMSKPTREPHRRFWGRILVVHPERLDDALLDASVANQRRHSTSHLSLLACVGDARGLRPRVIIGDRWDELAMPTVLVSGDRDVFAPPRVRGVWRDVAARNPNVELVSIPGAGHLPWLDEPDLVLGALERFLAPTLAPTPGRVTASR